MHGSVPGRVAATPSSGAAGSTEGGSSEAKPRMQAAVAVRRAAPAQPITTSTTRPPQPTWDTNAPNVFDEIAGGGGAFYNAVPRSVHDGSIDLYRPWGNAAAGLRWWEFKVRQAVAAIKRKDRPDPAMPIRASSDPMMTKVVAMPAQPKLKGSVHDVLDRRAAMLIERIRGIPDQQERASTAQRLLVLSQKVSGQESSGGMAIAAMQALNKFGLDVDEKGLYNP